MSTIYHSQMSVGKYLSWVNRLCQRKFFCLLIFSKPFSGILKRNTFENEDIKDSCIFRLISSHHLPQLNALPSNLITSICSINKTEMISRHTKEVLDIL